MDNKDKELLDNAAKVLPMSGNSTEKDVQFYISVSYPLLLTLSTNSI